MATRTQKIWLGGFTVVAGALLALVLIAFGGMRFWQRHDRYRVVFRDTVLGLQPGAQVFLGGTRVGTVDAIALCPTDASEIRVVVELDRGTPVRADTLAMLTMSGITGLKIIDLRGGSAGAPPLPPGALIATGETTLDKIESQASDLVRDSGEMMKQAGRVVERAGKIMDNLVALTAPEQLDGLHVVLDQATVIGANLIRGSAELDGLVREARSDLHASLGTEVPRLLASAGAVVDAVAGVVRNNEGQVRSSMFDLRQATRSLKELAATLREHPSALLFSDAARDRPLP